jgi:hypothetical protein
MVVTQKLTQWVAKLFLLPMLFVKFNKRVTESIYLKLGSAL